MKSCDHIDCKGGHPDEEELEDVGDGYKLGESCNDKYDNRTGYCDVSCCMGYGCTQVC